MPFSILLNNKPKHRTASDHQYILYHQKRRFILNFDFFIIIREEVTLINDFLTL